MADTSHSHRAGGDEHNRHQTGDGDNHQPHLYLACLGPPLVTYDGQPVTMPTRKALALLIYLAVEGGVQRTPQPRARLATLFFPESSEQRSRSALRSTLAYLRRGLDAAGSPNDSSVSHQILHVDNESLAIHQEAEVILDLQRVAACADSEDATQFEDALALARGAFLETLTLPDAPDFDEWVQLQTAYWQQQISALYQRLVQLQTNAHQLAAAINTTLGWLAHDPLNESAHRQLIQLYALNGDSNAALAAYAACRDMLWDELGAEPSSQTQRLVERIQSGDLFAYPLDHAPAPGKRAAGTFVMPFAGRSTEYGQLTDIYHAVRRGETHVVIVEGEMGIGKTRLAQEFVAWLQLQGVDLLFGRAFEAGGRLPYQPLVDALRVRLELENAPDDLLGDVWLAELSRLLPELRERYPDLPPPISDESLSRTRLPAAVARLIEALAQRAPLVWFVDDLQWADTASCDLLLYTCRAWSEKSAPVLLLLTLRSETISLPGPVASNLRTWLASLERVTTVTSMKLNGLNGPETAQLAASLVGVRAGARLGQWLESETGGQPLFMAEALKVLRDQGVLVAQPTGEAVWTLAAEPAHQVPAPGLRQLILTRLDALTPAAASLLAAAAVMGRPCTFERLCQITGINELEALPELELLLQRELLQESNNARPYAFMHDRIRDVVYTECGDARRRLYHRRALASLEASQSSAAELAHHALAAHLAEPAFRYSLAAGRAAMVVFALRDAAGYFEQALTLVTDQVADGLHIDQRQQAELYDQLSRAYEHLGEYAQAKTIADSWLALARAHGDQPMQADALDRLAALATYTHQLERSTILLQEALDVAQTIGDQRRLAAIEWSLAQAAHHRNDMPASKAYAASALSRARRLEDAKLIAGTLNSLAYACLFLGEVDSCIPYMEEARARFQTLGDRALEADCMVGLAAAHNWSGRAQDALEAAQTGYAIALEIESLWGQVINGVQATLALGDLGYYWRALQTAERDLHLARPHKGALLLISSMAAGAIYRALGDLQSAHAAHLETRTVAEASGVPNYLALTATDLCTDAALLGDWSTAYAHAQEAIAQRDYTMTPLRYHPQWPVTAALLRGGDAEVALTDLQRAGSIVAHIPRFRLDRLRALALVAARQDDRDKAIAHLEVALQLAEQFSLPGEQWQILMQLRGLTDDATQIQHMSQRIDAILNALAQTIADVDRRTQFLDVMYGPWSVMLNWQ